MKPRKIGHACPTCGCQPTGVHIGNGEHLYDPPDPECDHECHAPWRMINKSKPTTRRIPTNA